jgi:hypothetical protein
MMFHFLISLSMSFLDAIACVTSLEERFRPWLHHDNPMMIGFVGDEMTLKITLLFCDSIVIINALVSCIIGHEEKFRPLITLTATNVDFSTNVKLCCCTNSLLMKHADALESKNA